ncbi:unnamed protein product [Allacma fusca]|uniref:Uncharacterized protein n=1 Tax=Allacma fusca TaxID=39272 RepID=A0A8J2L2U7_9HEXA|nr:unnamed protein product [Allacma fusca]
MHPGAEVATAQDPSVVANGNIVYDVGVVFDPGTQRFDHHQATYFETFSAKESYGLVVGKAYSEFFQHADLYIDNGYDIHGEMRRVTQMRQVEAAKLVPRQRVRPGLQHNVTRLVRLDDLAYYWLENVEVALVVNPIIDRHVHRVALPFGQANVGNDSRSGEVVAVLVEGECHHHARSLESVLGAICHHNDGLRHP